MALNKLINHHAKYSPNKLALVFRDQEYSWSQFAQEVNKISNGLLQKNIKINDKVATILPNSLELISLYWAVTAIGAVVVPLSPLLKARGMVNLLQNSDSVMVFLTTDAMEELKSEVQNLPDLKNYIICDNPKSKKSFEAFIKEQKNTPPVTEEIHNLDLFNIMFSSGTTGMPKGIEHSHLVRSNYCFSFATALRMSPESVVIHSGSIVFNGAFVDLMPSFYLGATYILLEKFDADEFIATVAKYKVTHTIMVPTQIVALLQSPNATLENLKSLEMIMNIGAPLSERDKHNLCQILPNRLYDLYGLTEGFVTILDKNYSLTKLASVGTPPVGFELRIVNDEGIDLPAGEVGEIVGRGPIQMSAYYKQPELTAETVRDGWIFTGDLGYVDEDGFLFLAGRKKDLIISGGVNVYPSDIENIIVQQEEVLEVAVIGVDSEKWGEVPVAGIVLKPESTVQKDELINWVNNAVEAKFHRLSDLFFIEAFPRNAAGKVLKNELKEIYHDN